jgi:hypothetical protein
VTWWKFAAWVAAGGVLIAAVGIIDYMRPAAQRTHLGGFVAQVISGDAWAIIIRKAAFAWNSIFGGSTVWVTALVLLAVGIVLFSKPVRSRFPALQSAMEAWLMLYHVTLSMWVAAVLGSVVNDYGVRIAMVALVPAVPMIAGVIIQRINQRDDGV